MFQPQPTPYSSFYPAYLPVGVEDDGLSDGFGGVQAAGYSTYPQAPFASLSLGGPGPQAGAPGPPASGSGPAGGSCHDAHGGAAGVPVDVRSAPLPVFPFHSTLPLHQHHQPGAPNLFDHRRPPPLQHRPRHQQQQQQQQHQHYSPINRPASHVKMEQNQGLPDDFAAQEAAARTWEPEVEGPLLGDKTTITAITEQYAKADPIYVDKTMALPQTYSHYRPVKGDGNCGWRAIGFCYFELLIQQGSQELVDGECLRLTQLNDYLVNSGNYDPDLFMDFVTDTFDLFKQISANIHDHDTAMDKLITTFNGPSSMSILFHLRLLAGAWLRGNRDQYAGWCEADPETYAQTVIEPAQREIEELGVVLLVEVLLKPAGFTLEIAYLDRSQGSQVNTHRFPDGDPNNIGPFIHLLYRPGHYDILYKPTPTTTLQVNRMAYAPTYHESAGPQFQDTFSLTNPLALIPGFGTVGPVSSMGQLTGSSLDYPSSPQSPWFSSPYADSSPTPPAQPQQSQQTSLPTQSIPGPSTTHEIRFSRYQYAEPMDTNAWPEQPLQTNTFKNSHFNTAHYNNPNFQPEEYRPGYDDWIERCERPAKKKGHHKAGHSSSDDSTGRGETKTDK